MNETELIELAAAVVGIGLVLFGLRRAATKSKERAPDSIKERIEEASGLGPRTSARKDEAKKAEEKPSEAEARGPKPEARAEDAEAASAYRAGLAKTRGGFVARLGKLFGKKQIDAATLDELEEVLFTADIGPRAAERIFQSVKGGLSKSDLENADKIWDQIRTTSREILAVDAPAIDLAAKKPFVLLVLGVNGVGKTTTIAKLASLFVQDRKKVMFGACDTFRAAAIEQLEVWAQRLDVEVIKHQDGSDPAAVAYDATLAAKARGADVLFLDTAGRLHTKVNLMEEMKKIKRVVQKEMRSAPHETLLVVDATNGQNAIMQTRTFHDALSLTGIVVTKLDGTAKGGFLLPIAHTVKLPIRFIGVGEKMDDLIPFRAKEFATAMFE